MGFVFEKNKLISDVMLITPKVFSDERGFFMETHNQKEFELNGIKNTFVQDNHSKSNKGVFRGFHLQINGTQSKLVRVILGSVLDFAIDLRKNSDTYGKYITELLSEKNKKQLFIPKGFAHGFLALEDGTQFLYKCDDFYNSKEEIGILYNDSYININWEYIKNTYSIKELVFSKKDKENIKFEEFDKLNPF